MILSFKERAGCPGGKGIMITEDKATTLATHPDQAIAMAFDGYNSAISEKESTLGVNCGLSSGRNGIVTYTPDGNHCASYHEDEKSATLQTWYHYGDGGDGALVVLEGNGQRPSHMGDGYAESEQMYTLNATEQHAVCYGICSLDSNAMKSSNPKSGFYEAKTSRTLDLNGGNPNCNQGGVCVVEETVCMASTQAHAEIGVNVCPTLTNDKDHFPTAYKECKPRRKYIIRRLTPLECCRLQGFPDYWTDGVPGSDSAKYKMWGNGIALPCAVDVLLRIKNSVMSERRLPQSLYAPEIRP